MHFLKMKEQKLKEVLSSLPRVVKLKSDTEFILISVILLAHLLSAGYVSGVGGDEISMQETGVGKANSYISHQK